MPICLMQAKLICCFIVTLIAYSCWEMIDDDNIDLNATETNGKQICVTKETENVHSEIFDTPWFKHHTCVSEGLFDVLFDGMKE